MKNLIVVILGLLLLGVGFVYGSYQAQSKYEAIGMRALAIVQGGHHINHWHKLSKLEFYLNENKLDEVIQEINSIKNMIELQLTECFSMPTCEDEFDGQYPSKWLQEIHTNKTRNEMDGSVEPPIR